MNISKNKLNSKISWLFNFCQTHAWNSYSFILILLLLNELHEVDYTFKQNKYIYIYNFNYINYSNYSFS